MELVKSSLKVAKFVIVGAMGLFVLGAMLFTVADVAMQIVGPQTEVTNRKPFADYIGREYSNHWRRERAGLE